MNGQYSWIYVDYKENIWKFWENDKKELCCNIMFKEGKWTKEILIDKNVLGFGVFIEENGKIHIVYSNTNGEIKYCTLRDNRWIGRVLYLLESDEFEIRDLNIVIICDEMHFFYLLTEVNGSNHAVLMHSIWNGTDASTMKLADLILIPNEKQKYIVKADKENHLDVLFITDEGKDITLNHCRYEDSKWTSAKRLYSIQGHDIEFEMLNHQQGMHILNKHKEGSGYYLDLVRIHGRSEIQKFRIYASRKVIAEPLLFQQSNRLYSCWLEDNRIFYSVFSGVNWSKPIYFNRGNEDKVEKYHFYIAGNQEMSMTERDVYGTSEIDFNLFFPSQLVKGRSLSKCEVNQAEGIQCNEKQTNLSQLIEAIQNLKQQLHRLKSENKQLEKTAESFRLQLQKKQSFIDAYSEKITKALEQKQYSEENCNMFMELLQQSQLKLESLNQQLSEGKKDMTDMENKWNQCKTEKEMMKQQMEKIIEEKNKLQQEIKMMKNKLQQEFEMEKNKLISEFEMEKNRLSVKFEREKNRLANEFAAEKNKLTIESDLEKNRLLSEFDAERNNLRRQLELEKNKSIVERLIKSRS